MNPSALLRTIVVFAICLPVAIFLGYIVAGPFNYTFVGVVGTVVLILIAPLLLRYHYALLVLGWNCTMIVFFLPSAPGVWLPLVAVSLTLSVVRRTIDSRYRFISVPSMTWPLVALAVVVLVTAEMTGGIGLRSFGGAVYGGKRYVFMLGGILGYFALTAQRIPREQAGIYIALFFLGGITIMIGDTLYFQSRALEFIYWFFPPTMYLLGGGSDTISGGATRFAGLGMACQVLGYLMLAKLGIRGIFTPHRPWRFALFAMLAGMSLLGGFRSSLIMLILVFCIQFFLEGAHRTRLLPVLLGGLLLVGIVSLPFVQRFPLSVQRSLAFLPLPIDAEVRANAEGSSAWRINIWQAVLPQVPQYLLLGKGLAMTHEELDYSLEQQSGTMKAASADQEGLALSGDYHNGPLSVIIQFGIWGVVVFLWLIGAAIRVLYRNYRYGDPELRIVNSCLLALFVAKVIVFLFVYGGFAGDMQIFVGYVGLSVSLNGGVAKPAREPVPEPSQAAGLPDLLPRPRTAMGRSA
jgi:hypothetical protein